ncbi:MAG: DNA mismatch repair protein MutH [Bradymonadia bacterium]|jgi:DNA mismatch repair protein MutH
MSNSSDRFEDLWPQLCELAGRPFGDLLPQATLQSMHLNKGGAGLAIESLLGIPAGSRLTDYVDGELKTYRADRDGFPMETVAITQIGSDVDRYLDMPRFVDTPLHEKVRHTALLGVYRDSDDPADWQIALAMELDASEGSYWFDRLERSYNDLLAQLLEWLREPAPFHTMNAQWLQIRVRDSKPYTPLVSERLGRELWNKKLGFYFQRQFVRALVEESFASGELPHI